MNNKEKYNSLSEVAFLATELMKKHELFFWKLKFNNQKSSIGACCPTEKTIYLSSAIILFCTKDLVKKTILHEIAHALVGIHHGHDIVWKRKCIEIGGDGKRLTDKSEVDFSNIKFAYKGICPNGHTFFKSRMPKREHSCTKCCPTFNENYLIVWEKQ